MFAKRASALSKLAIFVLPLLLLILYDVHLTYFLLPSSSAVSGSSIPAHLALVNASDIPPYVQRDLLHGRYARTEVGPLSPCKPFLVYDKPPKTGSSALTQALKGMLRRRLAWRDPNIAVCDRVQCAALMDRVCEGAERVHMLQHVNGRTGRIECLKKKGYYAVTSVREPGERWRSAFRYNRMVKGNHFGVPWNETYQTFMQHVPRCKMLWYYDGLDEECTDESLVDDRIQSIVMRYDEIIEMGASRQQAQVERLLKGFVRDVNVSPRTHEGDDVAYQRIKFEQQLYHAFLERRAYLLQHPTSVFCAPQR